MSARYPAKPGRNLRRSLRALVEAGREINRHPLNGFDRNTCLAFRALAEAARLQVSRLPPDQAADLAKNFGMSVAELERMLEGFETGETFEQAAS